MLRGWIFDQQQRSFEEIESKRLKEWHDDVSVHWRSQSSGQLVWIDLCNPDEKDYALLCQRMELHSTVVENLKTPEGRPKIQQFEKYFYMTLYAVAHHHAAGNVRVELQEIDCLVGDNYLITVHQENVSVIDTLAEYWKTNPPKNEGGIAYLVYDLLDNCLDQYFPALDAIDDRLDELEDVLFEGNGKELTGEIFALKRTLIRIRQVAAPMREVVGMLMRHYADDDHNTYVYYQDLYDHVMRIIDLLDTFRDILSGAMDVYLAVESNRMNAVMKTLTSFSIIFLVPTLIAGIYGMNFIDMPELHYRLGYFVVLGIMAFSMVGLFVYFKRKDWI
jgi:magnesium transporter